MGPIRVSGELLWLAGFSHCQKWGSPLHNDTLASQERQNLLPIRLVAVQNKRSTRPCLAVRHAAPQALVQSLLLPLGAHPKCNRRTGSGTLAISEVAAPLRLERRCP